MLIRSSRASNLSVSTRTAVLLSLVIGALFVIVGIGVYLDARSEIIRAELLKLDRYNEAVIRRESQRFDRIRLTHELAERRFEAEIASLPPARAAELFDRYFPRHADGTRRSVDGLFDGERTPLGYLHGVGAFVGGDVDTERARVLLAATASVQTVGEGVIRQLKSLYYFNDDRQLVMFAPDRPDRLSYYRSTAPATLSWQNEEFARIVRDRRPGDGAMRCTSLQPILYDRTRTTLTTGCMTPLFHDGRQVGAWGTSVLLDDLVDPGRFNSLVGGELIIVSAEGRLIYHPKYVRQSAAATARFLDLTKATEPELKGLWQFIQDHDGDRYSGASELIGGYAVMRRLGTPNWYVIAHTPHSVIAEQSWRPVARVAITALICLVLQAIILFAVLRRQVGMPLASLSARVRQMTAQVGGRADAIEARTGDEVSELTERFEAMAEQVLAAKQHLEATVEARTTQLREANTELVRLTETDPLTALANRRKVMTALETRIADPARMAGTAIALFDLDHFKSINDQHGHLVGDRVLQAVAAEVLEKLRPTDLLGRIGGEEFLAILPAAGAEAAMAIAERIRAGVEALQIATPDGHRVRPTISVGVAIARRGDTAQSVYHRADLALYEAKRGGRNCTGFERPRHTAQLASVG